MTEPRDGNPELQLNCQRLAINDATVQQMRVRAESIGIASTRCVSGFAPWARVAVDTLSIPDFKQWRDDLLRQAHDAGYETPRYLATRDYRHAEFRLLNGVLRDIQQTEIPEMLNQAIQAKEHVRTGVRILVESRAQSIR